MQCPPDLGDPPPTERDKLKARFEDLMKKGLVNVNFDVDVEGALKAANGWAERATETVCGEINRMYDAIEAGHTQEMVFFDSPQLMARAEEIYRIYAGTDYVLTRDAAIKAIYHALTQPKV